eukprot:TRINITY_DN2334_c0_g1_i3.p4 TRINITY_DN2334_c0_g1~~TRINITY_DN2334_c0_g1_i3.p4  ORF type:complete len:145 (-),score=46.76 TRINITY_DN2334_c0_g1_i3:503-937(-)
MTLCLLMDKDMMLGDVLKRVGDRKGKILEKDCYAFKVFHESPTNTRTANRQIANTADVVHYKAMHNLSVLNMNTEVCNLPTLELHLFEKRARKAHVEEQKWKFRTMEGLKGALEQEEASGKEEVKKDYEYMYNSYTGTDYTVGL